MQTLAGADPAQGARSREARRRAAVILRAGWTTIRSAFADDFGMVASSIAFSSFLSMLPLLALVGLAYGAFTDPQEVVADLRKLLRVIPVEARQVVSQWLGEALLRREGREAGLALSLVLTVAGASRAGRSLLYGLNVAYRVERRRGFVARRATAVLIVLAAAALVTGALVAVSLFAFVARFLPNLPFASQLARAAFWTGTAGVACTMVSGVYRFGPARPPPPWRETVPGAVLASVLWLSATGLFSLYLSRFGDFGRVYGSLGTVIVLQLWLLGSAFAFLLGARFNVELADGEPLCGR